MILTDVAVRNRATVAVLTVFILVAGLYSYFTLPREAAPDVAMPLVMITTAYEGVAPEDVETSVTMKIEKELAGLKGLKKISSISAEGTSLITVEFMPDVVIEDALQYVRDRVDIAKPDLPVDAEEPAIREINIAEFPFMLVSISGDVSPVRLKAIADELEDRIESVQGVLGVDVIGALEREFSDLDEVWKSEKAAVQGPAELPLVDLQDRRHQLVLEPMAHPVHDHHVAEIRSQAHQGE